MVMREKLAELFEKYCLSDDKYDFADRVIDLLAKDGFKKVKEANIPEPDSDMLMDLAGQDEFIAFQIYVKSIGKANPKGLFTEE
jgi:hypothetical protein